jgi:hypothetical protein
MWQDLATILVNILGIVAGAWVVIWQMGRQHQSSLQLQRENQQDALKLSIYQDLSIAISAAQEAQADSAGFVTGLRADLITYWSVKDAGFVPGPLERRASEFQTKHSLATSKTIELIVLLERFEVVNPNWSIFRTAFSSALDDLGMAQIKLFQSLLTFLPIEKTEDEKDLESPRIIHLPVPSLQKFDREIKPLVDQYSEVSMNLTNYIYDLRVESQNTLLGNLFDGRAQKRKPLDPKYVVISTAPADMQRLEEYFNKKTGWEELKAKVATERSSGRECN